MPADDGDMVRLVAIPDNQNIILLNVRILDRLYRDRLAQRADHIVSQLRAMLHWISRIQEIVFKGYTTFLVGSYHQSNAIQPRR
jgi:hypothetical protein